MTSHPQQPPPLGADLASARGLRLDQLMLLATIVLVVATVTMSGALQALATQNEFNQSVATQRQRLEEQTRNVGRGIAQVLALSSASALRDNDFAFLSNLVGPVVRSDASIRRARITDPTGRALADTGSASDVSAANLADHAWAEVTNKGERLLEYREPITHDGKTIGAVTISYSLAPLQREVERLEQARAHAQRRILFRTGALAFVFILLGSVLAALQSRRITKPLAGLTVKALRVAQGDFDARVQESQSAGQEVHMLGRVFNYMAGQIKVLLDEARLRAQLDQQVQVARAVQESLLPTREIIEAGPLRIAGTVISADRCGGDFWAMARLDDQRVAVCLGDVTGHGLSTALVAAAAVSAFHHGTGFPELDTYEQIIRLNRTLYQATNGGHQMSCALAVVQTETGELEMTNAAHPFPFVFNRVTKSIRSLIAKGPRLGESLQSVFLPHRTTLEPGDIVVYYSDGVTEAEDASGQPYAAKRLRATLAANGHLPVDQIRDAILADVTAYTGGTRADDMTLVVVEYQPDSPRLPA
jgi:sigma-B regulation protein RsbU (phosphoserine phosphatase)